MIAHSLNGNTFGSPLRGSIGIYQRGSAGDSTMAWGDIIDGLDTLVKMDRCDNDMLMGDRFEGFITPAMQLDPASGFCSGVQILGGSISNSILGGGPSILAGPECTRPSLSFPASRASGPQFPTPAPAPTSSVTEYSFYWCQGAKDDLQACICSP